MAHDLIPPPSPAGRPPAEPRTSASARGARGCRPRPLARRRRSRGRRAAPVAPLPPTRSAVPLALRLPAGRARSAWLASPRSCSWSRPSAGRGYSCGQLVDRWQPPRTASIEAARADRRPRRRRVPAIQRQPARRGAGPLEILNLPRRGSHRPPGRRHRVRRRQGGDVHAQRPGPDGSILGGAVGERATCCGVRRSGSRSTRSAIDGRRLCGGAAARPPPKAESVRRAGPPPPGALLPPRARAARRIRPATIAPGRRGPAPDRLAPEAERIDALTLRGAAQALPSGLRRSRVRHLTLPP